MTADFLLVSDDKYVKNLGICTYSVMHNMCPEVDKVRLFVMDCGITEENKQRLHAQAAKFGNAEMIFPSHAFIPTPCFDYFMELLQPWGLMWSHVLYFIKERSMAT